MWAKILFEPFATTRMERTLFFARSSRVRAAHDHAVFCGRSDLSKCGAADYCDAGNTPASRYFSID
jgi:hypothetical protein